MNTNPEEMSVLQKALAEHGVAWKTFMEQQTETLAEIKARTLEVEQKLVRRGGGGDAYGDYGGGGGALAELAALIVESDQTKAFLWGHTPSTKIAVPLKLMKAAIVNASGQNQPLVVADRRPGITFAPERRFTIRDLFTQIPTGGNLIEFTRELLFTNQAGPQYDGTSPPGPSTEGAIKPESSITFELATTPVITVSHWIPASRQVLSDAPLLQRYLDQRLIFGVKLEEEDELLNADGSAGQMNGLINQATPFTAGTTGQTALDTLALSVGQLAAGEYMPSGFILNPRNWWSSALRLAKDSEGRYIMGDPAQDADPRLWGLPCVITNTMPLGEFVTLDAPRTGYIADREEANVRISEHHADFFIRNMVVLLAESRIALVVERPSAILHGNLSNAG